MRHSAISKNELTGFTDSNGNVTAYACDGVGNPTSITCADGKAESFAYDSRGNVVSWTNRRGNIMFCGNVL